MAARLRALDRGRLSVVVAVAALATSALALGLAPTMLDDSYSWVEHTTSESGAQGVDGAWLARAGFVLFGLAVFWIAHLRRERWGQPAAAFHLVFGVCLIGVAAFSLRSWEPNPVYDTTEDLLHSVAATVMGFAFAFGVAAVGVPVQLSSEPFRALDAIAVAASVVLPIWMSLDGSIDGALQRLMFALPTLWYGREALQTETRRSG